MADNPYSGPTISGYNASPPADDGSQVAANEVKWQTHLDKIGGPLKTFAEAISTAVSTAFSSTPNTGSDQQNTMAGSLAFTPSELTIATGAITPTRSHHTVDTESDAATDDLDTINTTSISDGGLLILRAADAGRTVVLKDGTGNLVLSGGNDYSLDDAEKVVELIRVGANFHEKSRSALGLTSISGWTNSDSAATTSGTSVDISSISAGVSEIFICLAGVSQSAANMELAIQLGDSGGFETTGYTGQVFQHEVGQVLRTFSAGFKLTGNVSYDAADLAYGIARLVHMGSNIWFFDSDINKATTNIKWSSSGTKTLTGELTQIRLTTESGAGTFDAGTLYLTAR